MYGALNVKFTLNIATCFDPKWITFREPNQSNTAYNRINFHAVLLWFGSLMVIHFGSKHVAIFSVT